MVEHFKFGRLDSRSTQNGYHYTKASHTDAQWSQRDMEMRETGAHWSVTIRNYMREDLLIVGSLRTEPQRYKSIYGSAEYMLENTTNYVIIELRHQDNEWDERGKTQTKVKEKITIRCPGHYLQTNSLFIEEMGWHLTIDDRLQATCAMIAQDREMPQASEISVPETAAKPNPVRVLQEFEPLLRNCIARADKIQVRVGVRVDIDPSRIPDEVKNLRIAILDRDFSPYLSNRMAYDPSLEPHEFVVENLHYLASEPIISTFDRLRSSPGRAFFIDTQERRTMGGVLCSLAIFADIDALSDYLFAHKAQEMYTELETRVADRSGNTVLKKQIEMLKDTNQTLSEEVSEKVGQLKTAWDQIKEYKRMVTTLEDSVKRFQSHKEDRLGFETIQQELALERAQLDQKQRQLEHDQAELAYLRDQAERNQKASYLKTLADMAKSTWGILGIVATAITVAWKGYNKLKTSNV